MEEIEQWANAGGLTSIIEFLPDTSSTIPFDILKVLLRDRSTLPTIVCFLILLKFLSQEVFLYMLWKQNY